MSRAKNLGGILQGGASQFSRGANQPGGGPEKNCFLYLCPEIHCVYVDIFS